MHYKTGYTACHALFVAKPQNKGMEIQGFDWFVLPCPQVASLNSCASVVEERLQQSEAKVSQECAEHCWVNRLTVCCVSARDLWLRCVCTQPTISGTYKRSGVDSQVVGDREYSQGGVKHRNMFTLCMAVYTDTDDVIDSCGNICCCCSAQARNRNLK